MDATSLIVVDTNALPWQERFNEKMGRALYRKELVIDPEAGLEVDVGALRSAATPFPLTAAGRNQLPRWFFRVGYTHSWIGHGTADGYLTSVRLTW